MCIRFSHSNTFESYISIVYLTVMVPIVEVTSLQMLQKQEPWKLTYRLNSVTFLQNMSFLCHDGQHLMLWKEIKPLILLYHSGFSWVGFHYQSTLKTLTNQSFEELKEVVKHCFCDKENSNALFKAVEGVSVSTRVTEIKISCFPSCLFLFACLLVCFH